MKLYLSSQGIGPQSEELRRMVGKNPRTAVIANGVDHYDKYSRQTRVRKEKQALRSVGLDPVELDLRRYFNDSQALKEEVSTFGLIWIRGGNVFNLRRAMLQSDFDSAALADINSGNIVYGGYSAAVALAGPDLYGSELVDAPNDLPAGYPTSETPYSALGLLEHYIAPHYLTDMPWRQPVLDYVARLRSNDREVMTLRDGEVYIREKAVGRAAMELLEQSEGETL